MEADHPRDKITVKSTSQRSADISPIVLRESTTTRLAFKPVAVENEKDPAAVIRGTFTFQKKRSARIWQDLNAIKLNSLKDGEGVRLDLSSQEVLTLFKRLSTLYDLVAENGIPRGQADYIPAPRSAGLRKVLAKGELEKFLEVDPQGEVIVQRFLEWASSRQDKLSNALQKFTSTQLLNFDAAISIARLESLLKRYEENRHNPDEDFWQDLFKENAWVISQLFTSSVILIRGQAYVGGKGIDNRGGNVADFLFKNSLTDDAALVEVKTPATKLLEKDKYRNNTWGPSPELSGGVQQLLTNRHNLSRERPHLIEESDLPFFQTFNPKAILILGSIEGDLTETGKRRCFELYRRNLRDVDVITFDEVYDKAKALVRLLRQP